MIRAYNHAGAVNHQTFLMAVNDMDMNNGCLEVVPGSHKQQVPLGANKASPSTLPKDHDPKVQCIEPAWEAKQTWIPVPMSAGSILVFGSYLAHRSGPNSSQKPRAAIYATVSPYQDVC
jgi:ectoine hydroxylase-related dioxygenase (phytanoyl-CoA dioxygenase family)